MQAEIVAFAAHKLEANPTEWEDGVRFDEGFGRGEARFVVVDGATEAFDVLRWVDLLVETFVPEDRLKAPELDLATIGLWLDSLQKEWVNSAPDLLNPYAESKSKEGSFATLMGCSITGLDTPKPTWRAVSVGDTVLFHVRKWELVCTFPSLSVQDFSNKPELVYTHSDRLQTTLDALRISEGSLMVGDVLFAATDALACWMIQMAERDWVTLFHVLATLDEMRFLDLISASRASGELKDDDVSLLRVVICADGRDRSR